VNVVTDPLTNSDPRHQKSSTSALSSPTTKKSVVAAVKLVGLWLNVRCLCCHRCFHIEVQWLSCSADGVSSFVDKVARNIQRDTVRAPLASGPTASKPDLTSDSTSDTQRQPRTSSPIHTDATPQANTGAPADLERCHARLVKMPAYLHEPVAHWANPWQTIVKHTLTTFIPR